jgi:bifunctional non-homologous end joining protein LigD
MMRAESALRGSSVVHADTVLGVRITHPDRVMYDQPRLTKRDVAKYYAAVAGRMLPHVIGRPLTLVRCGTGINGDCIFMKHSKVWAPPQLVRITQMDVLEIHTWNTRADRVELPDRIVIDLDPGKDVAWTAVIAAARLVKRFLEALDLESWVKTTGGRGLHVVLPLERQRPWDECLAFARSVADALTRHDPNVFTTTFGKRGRERLILVDYLRNNRTNTSIAAFSTRARPGAPVSTPIGWRELTPRLDPLTFTVETVERRLRRPDPWRDYFTSRQVISAKAFAALRAL